jgi:hypothetical protein
MQAGSEKGDDSAQDGMRPWIPENNSIFASGGYQ